MSYWITGFGGATLSTSRPMQDTGLPNTAAGLVELPGGGVYDPYGSDQAPVRLPYQVTTEMFLRGSESTIRTALYALRALVGTRGTLTRDPDDDALGNETVLARLRDIRVRRDIAAIRHLPIVLTFEILEHPWSGADATVSDVLDATPKNLTCANDGNARVDDAVITVTAGGSAITELTVTVSGVTALEWEGTLAVGTDLEIDCGAQTVTNDGTDAYDELSLGAGHAVAEWLRLPAGNTTVAVNRTGGDNTSAIEIAFDDGWA